MTLQREGALVSRRRGYVPRGLLLVFLLLTAAVVWVGMAAARQADPRVALAAIPAAPAPMDSVTLAPRRGTDERASRAGERTLAESTSMVFAGVQGLALELPHAKPLYIGFHEASRPEALVLDPVGRLIANDNATKFNPGEDRPGPRYHVLSSRGRGRPATSAADVVLPNGATVMAPITGRVVEVRDYALYGRLRDYRIVIQPDARPDLHVVLIHLDKPRVRVGDRAVAGATPLATVRLLPMSSHVDYALNERHPHVHIEVKPAVQVQRYDPNAKALEPGEDDGSLN